MQDFKEQFSAEQPGSFHDGMLAKLTNWVSSSKKKMSERYCIWDQNNQIYNLRREVDTEDVKAAERKEPIKQIIPMSYSQVQTFTAVCFQLFTQRDRFFELLPIGEGNAEPAKIAESFLQRDLDYSVWELKLYQYLLDIGKFGVGIVKTRWHEEYKNTPVQAQVGNAVMTTMRPVLQFAGNVIDNVSPYAFFPDPAFPMARFQEGEFVASEEVWAKAKLQRLQKFGKVYGLEHVPAISKRMVEGRQNSRVYSIERLPLVNGVEGQDTNNVIITEVQFTCVPADVEFDGQRLGDEDEPTKCVAWIANDSRIIKLELLGYPHGEYCYDLGEYNPDILNFANGSLQDSVAFLADTMTWFVNSRVTNVRKVIGNRLVVDPAQLEMTDLEERRPVIRLKAGGPRLGVDKAVKQLDVTDVTTNHVQDAGFFREMIQEVTGINDTLMGQVATGRRSATENRNAFISAAARVKMIALLIYRQGLAPMGRKMLANLRVGLTEPQVVRVVGAGANQRAAGRFLKASSEQLAGDYDFEMFDGTLASEKGIAAQALGELLTGMVSNPQAALALQIDPREVLLEYLELRGVRDPRRFTLPTIPQPQALNAPTPPTPGNPADGGPVPGLPGSGGQSLLSGIVDEGTGEY